MKRFLKVISVMLVLCLLVTLVIEPKAHAVAGVIIAGALVVTLGVVAMLALIAANSAGMGPAVGRAGADVGLSRETLMEQMLRSFISQRTLMQISTVLGMFSAGVKVIKATGEILYDAQTSEFMANFLDWAWSAEGGGLSLYADTASTGLVDISGISDPSYDLSFIQTIYVSDNASNINGNRVYNFYITNSSSFTAVCALTIGSNITYFFCSFNSFDVERIIESSHTTYSASRHVFNDQTIYYYTTQANQGFTAVNSSIPVSSFNRTVTAADYPSISYAILYGTISSDSEADPGVFVLDPGMDTAVQDPQDGLTFSETIGGAVVDVSDYLRMIVDVYYDGTATVVGTIEGTETTGTVEGTQEGTIPIEQTTTWEGVGEGEYVGAETGSPTIDTFSIDLKEFFPFCIPFDIYDMLNLFKASRAAPVIEWRVYAPGIIDENITLDFSVFDPVAAVLRSLELIGFAVGLAFETKKLLMGQ